MIDAVDINHQLEKIKMANSHIYFHKMLGLNCLEWRGSELAYILGL